MMAKYKYTGTEPKVLMDYHVDLVPGSVFEVDGEINHPEIEKVEDKKTVKEGDK